MTEGTLTAQLTIVTYCMLRGANRDQAVVIANQVVVPNALMPGSVDELLTLVDRYLATD